jgi:hypothetical protein
MIKRPGTTWWTFEAARNDSNMNQFSRLASLCWLANTDFLPCGIEAVINYAAKYAINPSLKQARGDFQSHPTTCF